MGSEKIINDDSGNQKEDKLGTGLSVASFCFPLVGAILYFVKEPDQPEAAKEACHLALWGFFTGIGLNILIRLSLS